MINQKLKLLIKERFKVGDFSGVKEILKSSNLEEISGILLGLGMDSDNDLSPYFFILELIFDDEKASLHDIAFTLLSYPFCWIPGAYQIALRHEQRAIKLEPSNFDYKKRILNLAIIPEHVLPIEEAANYAREVLMIFPQHKKSLEIMKRLAKNTKKQKDKK